MTTPDPDNEIVDEDELARTHVRLYADDLDLLRVKYPTGGYNSVIRRLVRIHCNALRKSTELEVR